MRDSRMLVSNSGTFSKKTSLVRLCRCQANNPTSRINVDPKTPCWVPAGDQSMHGNPLTSISHAWNRQQRWWRWHHKVGSTCVIMMLWIFPSRDCSRSAGSWLAIRGICCRTLVPTCSSESSGPQNAVRTSWHPRSQSLVSQTVIDSIWSSWSQWLIVLLLQCDNVCHVRLCHSGLSNCQVSNQICLWDKYYPTVWSRNWNEWMQGSTEKCCFKPLCNSKSKPHLCIAAGRNPCRMSFSGPMPEKCEDTRLLDINAESCQDDVQVKLGHIIWSNTGNFKQYPHSMTTCYSETLMPGFVEVPAFPPTLRG